MPSLRRIVPVLAAVAGVSSQTFSQCNPLSNPGACPPDTALGRSTTISFTQKSDSFSETGVVNYGSNGAEFTVAKSGDNPHITSGWYIMFGHVEFEVQAAPGQGIVSSAVLMSDCLDEIDWEWLGGDDNQVQSNYFRKGQTVTGYNRGAFHAVTGNHDQFHKYAIDWTADQIVWSIDGQTVRVLEAGNAQNGDYPQTPMQIKIGAWAGGDPSNAPGTIEWAGGLTTYSAGPFTMYLKSIAVTDYSTGKSYSYSGTTGNWESIQSDGGSINPQGSGQPVATSDAPAITSTVPNDSSAPLAFDPDNSASVYATRTGWPWTGTATASVVPPGWSIDGNGNIHPPSSGAAPSQSGFSAPESSAVSYSESGPEQYTTVPPIGPVIPTVIPAGAASSESVISSGLTLITISGSGFASVSVVGSSSQAPGQPTSTNGPSPAPTLSQSVTQSAGQSAPSGQASPSASNSETVSQSAGSGQPSSAPSESQATPSPTNSGGSTSASGASQTESRESRTTAMTTLSSSRTSSASSSGTESSTESSTDTSTATGGEDPTETPQAPSAGAQYTSSFWYSTTLYLVASWLLLL